MPRYGGNGGSAAGVRFAAPWRPFKITSDEFTKKWLPKERSDPKGWLQESARFESGVRVTFFVDDVHITSLCGGHIGMPCISYQPANFSCILQNSWTIIQPHRPASPPKTAMHRITRFLKPKATKPCDCHSTSCPSARANPGPDGYCVTPVVKKGGYCMRCAEAECHRFSYDAGPTNIYQNPQNSKY